MADFKDLGMKVAQNRQLSPQELADWGRLLNEITRTNSLIGSFVGPDNKENIVPKFPGVKVSLTSQAISNNLLTDLQWTTKDYDESYFFDSSQNTKIFFRTGGVYFINGVFTWATNGTGVRGAVLQINGVDYNGNLHNTVSGFPFANTISTEVTVVSGDYASVQVAQTSGGSLNCGVAFLAARLIR